MAVALATSFVQQFDNNGDPLNGGTVTVYDAGTTTSRNIYSDTALSVSASNPITLDSAGRHGMLYTAATAYKLLVKDSSGTTIYTRDNIDPGIPIGTGILGTANGGTGGNDPASARASLGAVGTSDIEDLEAQVAALAGAAGSSERTGIAVGTTLQRPAVPAVGDIRYNSTTGFYEFYTSGGWKNPYYTDSDLVGDVVKSQYYEYTTNGTVGSSDQIPYDDTIPQNTEGSQIISASFTPSNASNKLRFRFNGMFSLTAAGVGVCALFSGSGASAVAAAATRADSNDNPYPFHLAHEEVAGVTTAKTFAIRVGPSSAVTLSLNGTSAARRLGGVAKSVLVIEEVKV